MVCSGSRFSMPGKQFREQFRARYGTSPGMRCSYMYDAVTLAIQGLEQPGANRDTLKDILSGMLYSEGVTGVLSFDQWGDREQQVPLMTIRQGEPSLQDY